MPCPRGSVGHLCNAGPSRPRPGMPAEGSTFPARRTGLVGAERLQSRMRGFRVPRPRPCLSPSLASLASPLSPKAWRLASPAFRGACLDLSPSQPAPHSAPHSAPRGLSLPVAFPESSSSLRNAGSRFCRSRFRACVPGPPSRPRIGAATLSGQGDRTVSLQPPGGGSDSRGEMERQAPVAAARLTRSPGAPRGRGCRTAGPGGWGVGGARSARHAWGPEPEPPARRRPFLVDTTLQIDGQGCGAERRTPDPRSYCRSARARRRVNSLLF